MSKNASSLRHISFVSASALALAACLGGCHAITGSDKGATQEESSLGSGAEKPVAVQPVGGDGKPQPEVFVAEQENLLLEDAAQPAAQSFVQHQVKVRKKEQFSRAISVAPAAQFQPVTSPASFPQDRENYQHLDDNPLKLVAEQPVSTFSIDVDTGSYSNVRRFINQGQLPRQDAVRVEEMINYFQYDYAGPESDTVPFAIHTEMAPTPWRSDSVLLHVGLKGYEVSKAELPPANLVFLIDVSGSMNSPAKIGLLKQGFRLLTQQLRPEDTISIAVYAGASGTVLEPTSGDKKAKILAAIEQLTAGGATNGAAGIDLAYQLAKASFQKEGINRVILATDGDFNVGRVNFEALKDMVERRRETGISLTTLGFGTGNYNDHLMEQLADAGNGNYAYIDNLQEARKVLVEEMGSTLQTIASDVKIQIEFNPDAVLSYRLVGYENRMLKREDFNNDNVDAGEIGAGHSVTAIYELELADTARPVVDTLRYGKRGKESGSAHQNAEELGFLKLRYKLPTQKHSQLITQPLMQQDILDAIDNTSDNFRFAAAVAGFGQLLRGGKYTGNLDYEGVVQLGMKAKGRDDWGYRSEFINLVRLASHLEP